MFYFIIFETFLEWWEYYFGWPLDKPNLIYLMWCGIYGGTVGFIYDLFFTYRVFDSIFYKYELFGFKKEEIKIEYIYVHTELIKGTLYEAAIVGLWLFVMVFGLVINKYIYLFLFYLFSFFSFSFNYINLYYLMRFLIHIFRVNKFFKSSRNKCVLYYKKVFNKEKINFVLKKKKKC